MLYKRLSITANPHSYKDQRDQIIAINFMYKNDSIDEGVNGDLYFSVCEKKVHQSYKSEVSIWKIESNNYIDSDKNIVIESVDKLMEYLAMELSIYSI